MLGGAYLALYLCCGMLAVRFLLPRQPVLSRVWLGLSLGLLEMMWLPALCAFALRFTWQAHLAALVPLALLTLACFLLRDRHPAKPWDAEEKSQLLSLLLVALPLTALGGYLQFTHSNCVFADGSWNVGQSTYGDLPMHTAFITGLKNAAFPPEYPFYPGHRLSYPFLMDSLSTSFYLMGWSLQAALVVPGTLMMALCYCGALLLGRRLSLGKKAMVLAALLFFLNGGLGFLYDFDLAGGRNATVWSRIQDILQGYYKTPTNQPEPNNLRWSNVIADLMVPQRTLLGGWCMVIPCFYLLFTVYSGKQVSLRENLRPLVLLGVWAGGLPLIQTHAFLALGLCSLGLMLYDLTDGTRFTRLCLLLLLACLIGLGFAAQQYMDAAAQADSYRQYGEGYAYWVQQAQESADTARRFLLFWALGLAASAALLPILALIMRIRSPERFASQIKSMGQTLLAYLPYGALAVLLAAPQLIFFTFAQAFMNVGTASASHTFLTMQFNWVNNSGGAGMKDLYFWFYLKNIGLPFALLLLALCEKDTLTRRIFSGAGMIILAAEFVRFQPNEYDNNKLFYLAWLLCCMIVARYAAQLWQRLKGLRGRRLLAIVCAVITFLSAALTLWRECVSSYQAYSPQAVAAAEWVRDNTKDDDVFVTGTQHLNPVSSIAGRTIICGPDLWLYWHGFDTTQRKNELRAFFADPESSLDAMLAYGADYIFISSYERGDYAIDQSAFDRLFTRVYQNGECVIYRIDN